MRERESRSTKDAGLRLLMLTALVAPTLMLAPGLVRGQIPDKFQALELNPGNPVAKQRLESLKGS